MMPAARRPSSAAAAAAWEAGVDQNEIAFARGDGETAVVQGLGHAGAFGAVVGPACLEPAGFGEGGDAGVVGDDGDVEGAAGRG